MKKTKMMERDRQKIESLLKDRRKRRRDRKSRERKDARFREETGDKVDRETDRHQRTY